MSCRVWNRRGGVHPQQRDEAEELGERSMIAHDYIDNELKKVSPGRIGTVG